MGHVQKSFLIPATQEALFAYLTDLENLPEQLADVIEIELPDALPQLAANERVSLQMTRYNVAVNVVCRIEQLETPNRIVYRQVSGGFKRWLHTILLERHNDEQTKMTDIVEYEMPLGIIGSLLDDLFVSRDIGKILKTRAQRIEAHFRGESEGEEN